jgi:hypothetical protein
MLVTFNGASLGFVRSSKGEGPIILRSPDPIVTDTLADDGTERVIYHEADGIYSLPLTPPQSARFDALMDDLAMFATILDDGKVTLPDPRKGRHVTAGASLLDALRARQADAVAEAEAAIAAEGVTESQDSPETPATGRKARK